MILQITWSGGPADSIHNRLAARLGREPTLAEDGAEVRRILAESAEEQMIKRAGEGRLPWQRRR